MPRTKQPKMSKKAKKEMNASDSSILSNCSISTPAFKSYKEVKKRCEDERANMIKKIDNKRESILQEINEELAIKLVPNKHLLKTVTIKDLMEISKKPAQNPQYMEALNACINGTYEPPPALNFPEHGNNTGSSVRSGATVSSTISSSLRPPSSASSVRSGHSSRGAGFPYPGSVKRSRSVVKASLQVPVSGMRRRSLSQPGSLNKAHLTVGRTPIITPKVHPDSKNTVLRLPKTGESLYSVSGSPILPNATATSNKAPHTLIPLRDGNMLAVMPKGDGQNLCPMDFSPDTKRNLMLLRQNLDQLIKD